MTDLKQLFSAAVAVVSISHLHTQTHTQNKVCLAVWLPVTSYQVFTHVETEGRAVCIPALIPCRLPVNHSRSRFTEVARTLLSKLWISAHTAPIIHITVVII